MVCYLGLSLRLTGHIRRLRQLCIQTGSSFSLNNGSHCAVHVKSWRLSLLFCCCLLPCRPAVQLSRLVAAVWWHRTRRTGFACILTQTWSCSTKPTKLYGENSLHLKHFCKLAFFSSRSRAAAAAAWRPTTAAQCCCSCVNGSFLDARRPSSHPADRLSCGYWARIFLCEQVQQHCRLLKECPYQADHDERRQPQQ
jgi:hypothetical protein